MLETFPFYIKVQDAYVLVKYMMYMLIFCSNFNLADLAVKLTAKFLTRRHYPKTLIFKNCRGIESIRIAISSLV